MKKAGISLLPSVSELERLPESTAQHVIQAIDKDQQREHWYASLGMVCGTVSFLVCVVAYVYLVMQGHPGAAGAVLGAGVLAIVGRMIAARL